MSVLHPIDRAWVSTGGTGARNYDEFADETEITEIIRANPDSALAIEMPHRAPDSLGASFSEALPDAVRRLERQRADGSYTPAESMVGLYRIAEPGNPDGAGYGLIAMVDTSEISATADEPGRVIRNEDVFLDKVRERVALAEATQHLLSPVLLLQTGEPERVHAALREAVEAGGPPAVVDTDHSGRIHAVWPVPAGPRADDLLALAGAGDLVVADGNHRSLAAQIGRLPRFLAVVTTAGSVRIQPYHRLVTELPVPAGAMLDRLATLGARVAPAPDGVRVPDQGTVVLACTGTAWTVDLPVPEPGASIVDGMDHTLVEGLLLRDALGLDPGDKRVTYVGGDYPPSWLAGEVDAGRADLAVLLAPVTVADFVAVNLARQRMPRKSTWFTPKARAGLVLAELSG
jgi:uncharacterized protein (DUF1015 family)